MDLEIYDDTKNVPEEKIKLIEDILNFAGSYLKLPENTEMSVTLMDNEHIHEINKKYRGVDKPTDVISFAIEEDDPDEVPIILPEDEEFRNMMTETPDDKSMYVITNKSKLFGAAAMLYEENLYDLSQQLDSDLYILPSSTHEVIAISDKFGDANELADMVYEINMDQVELSDRLSNQVYHYDKDARTLRLATNKFERTISDDIKEKVPEIEEGKAR